MYVTTLLILHVLGAIIGFGPTFAFAVLGRMASESPGPVGVGLMKAMVRIERALVGPIANVVQPTTGTLLIFARGWDDNFFTHHWLLGALVLYVVAIVLAVRVQNPALEKMIELAESGEADTPVFGALAQRTARVGPALQVLLVLIAVLMVWKPS